MTQPLSYPSDLTDTQWKRLEPLIPPAKPGGRPRTANMRQVTNAILYLLRTGCQWRMLPHDFPPWQTVYGYFRKWKQTKLWQTINDLLRQEVRVAAGRDPEPSAAILDSQSVKTTEQGGTRGYDAAKKINGRKRHILVDTLGLLLMVVVHAASLQDFDGAKLVLFKVRHSLPRLVLIWADQIYTHVADWVNKRCHWTMAIVKRPEGSKGFQVLPRRWVVERTLAWLGRSRRLSKDYERLTETSESMVYAAMIHLMLKRLDRVQTA